MLVDKCAQIEEWIGQLEDYYDNGWKSIQSLMVIGDKKMNNMLICAGQVERH